MKSIEERFWQKVVVIQDETSCWEWLASKNAGGYGQFKWGTPGSPVKAHRAAWMIEHGPVPESKVVMHECDNPSCVRPSHLKIGTHKDNMQDMIEKRRQARGQNPKGRRKLTNDQVKEIRSRYETESASMRRLAREFGINSSNVSRLINGQQWADV